MKTLITFQEHDIITKITEPESEFGSVLGYSCKYNIFSEFSISLTTAISNIYQKVTNTKTKFSGPAIMGFDTPIISKTFIQNIPFQVYIIPLEKLRIWVLGVGKSNNNEYNFAEARYKAAFVYKYQNKQFKKTFIDSTPNLLWNKLDCLKQYSGKKLFGLEEPYTQNII
ncbi:20710_t:CDS:2 [Dentiscutata erythropus]|uniref:20710_t:CDS:1 n=1 Tax=Dentiscutata erythropus TaxID=1348616 RepID=A0A9N9IVL3_9GLOM|nr:20710_t:CDS:2 [Dentiscutata erythropus]